MTPETKELETFFKENKNKITWIDLCSQFGGRDVYIPKSPTLKHRDEQIRNEYDQLLLDEVFSQEALAILAKLYCLSERLVFRIVGQK